MHRHIEENPVMLHAPSWLGMSCLTLAALAIPPASAGADGKKIDVYAADQKYRKSFWFKPKKTK